jgi:hypothetical protein
MGNKSRQFPENYQQNRNVTTLFDILCPVLPMFQKLTKVNKRSFHLKMRKRITWNAHIRTNSDGLTWPTSYLLNKDWQSSVGWGDCWIWTQDCGITIWCHYAQWWASYFHKVMELLYFRYYWKKLALLIRYPFSQVTVSLQLLVTDILNVTKALLVTTKCN